MITFNPDKEPKITPGFKTPEGYFDDFSKQMLAKLPFEKNEVNVISFWERNKTRLLAVAAVVLITASIPLMNLLNADAEAAEVAGLEEYITNHSTITDDDLVEAMDMETIESMSIQSDFETTVESEVIESVIQDEINMEDIITN